MQIVRKLRDWVAGESIRDIEPTVSPQTIEAFLDRVIYTLPEKYAGRVITIRADVNITVTILSDQKTNAPDAPADAQQP